MNAIYLYNLKHSKMRATPPTPHTPHPRHANYEMMDYCLANTWPTTVSELLLNRHNPITSYKGKRFIILPAGSFSDLSSIYKCSSLDKYQ